MRISDWSSDVCSSDLFSDKVTGFVLAADCPQRRNQAHSPKKDFYQSSQIGRASCRERVCQYVSISVVAVSLNNNTSITYPLSILPSYILLIFFIINSLFLFL